VAAELRGGTARAYIGSHVSKTLVRSADTRLALIVFQRDTRIPVRHAEGADHHGSEGRVWISHERTRDLALT
jgi:hypothetical protein